jgi:hypothetical protein
MGPAKATGARPTASVRMGGMGGGAVGVHLLPVAITEHAGHSGGTEASGPRTALVKMGSLDQHVRKMKVPPKIWMITVITVKAVITVMMTVIAKLTRKV